jgi:hypothetical protein
MSNINLIVAHYNENIQWINNLNESEINKIYLYSKNQDYRYNLSINDKIKHQYLPNIGREAHTYLYHIVSNYYNLGEYNIFLQGSPSIRKPYENRIHSLFCKPFIKNKVSHSYNFSKRMWPGLNKQNKLLKWRNVNLLDTGKNFYEWFNEYIDDGKINLPYKIYFEANFAVRKDKILSRSINYYSRLIDQLPTNNTEAAHFLERSWYYIFNLHRQ